MTNQNKKLSTGQVIEALPNAMFRIQMDGAETIIGFLSGKMKINKIKVIVGDRVQVELDPYGGKATNRIIRRL